MRAVKSRSRQTASNPSCIVCAVFLRKKLFYTSAFYRLGETVCIAHAKLPGLSIENNFLGQRTWCVTSGSLFSVPPNGFSGMFTGMKVKNAENTS